MHLGRREREGATSLPARALGAHRTTAAGGRRKADDHRLLLTPILRLGPAHTLLPLRTGRHLRLPIEGKVGDRIAAVLALLPTGLLAHRSDDLRAQARLAHQLGPTGVALVH